MSASTDGSARLWDVAAGTQKAISEGYPKGAMCLALSRDGRSAAVGSADRLVRVLQVPSWEDARVFESIHASTVRGVAFLPDGKRLCSVGNDMNVVLTEIESGRRAVLSGHEKEVFRVACSPDGRWIASVARTRRCGSGTPPRRRPSARSPRPTGSSRSRFSPGGELMVAGTADGSVRVWNVMALHAAR
jgi:WD40 repeat protein